MRVSTVAAGFRAGFRLSPLREEAQGYFLLFRRLIRRYGVPVAAYNDRHGIFHRDARTPWALAGQLQGAVGSTQIGRALQELDIRRIPDSTLDIEHRFPLPVDNSTLACCVPFVWMNKQLLADLAPLSPIFRDSHLLLLADKTGLPFATLVAACLKSDSPPEDGATTTVLDVPSA